MPRANRESQICTRCVMDTQDPSIIFDENGECNHCKSFDSRKSSVLFDGTKGRAQIKKMVSDLKRKNKNRQYDCIIGLSGGVDSSYLAYWAVKEAKLRVLAVHVDGGWNSEIAVSNIEKIVNALNINLITHVVNWEEMRDLQVSFLRAGVANQDTPQDHAFFAALYNFANKNNIKTVLNGYNFNSESVLPISWGYSAMDLDQINSIHANFGKGKLSSFPKLTFWKYYIYYPFIKRMNILCPLNYLEYNKFDAIELLKKEFNWTYYGGKHYESRFTKFFQSYWLPERFGYDKRKAHLSSLVLAGQLSREKALEELSAPPYIQDDIPFEQEYIAKKLKLSVKELEKLFASKPQNYKSYRNNQFKMKILQQALYFFSLPSTIFKKLLTKIAS